jgi:AcrR family transcriptional regulator
MASTQTTVTARTKARPGGRTARVREVVKAAAHAELREKGYDGLSHRLIAQRAGVDVATVYRRWPTRSRLVADLLLDIAAEQVRVPDTGSLVGDLTDFLRQIVAGLANQDLRRLAQALSAAASEGDEEVAAALREFWDQRFKQAFVMLDRAVAREELAAGADYQQIIEALVAQAWFRALVSREPTDDAFIARYVVLAVASSIQRS